MKAARSLAAPSFALVALGLVLPSASLAEISQAKVERPAADALALTWASPDPVDVYESARPDASPKTARLVARGVRAHAWSLRPADLSRRYFLLVDARDHQQLRVAERLVPLAQGSNFRDIGGYAAAGGKHVRWGLIYRSGGQPMLTAEDLAEVGGLGLAQLVDLRSNEERALAPTRIDGVPYTAIGYSMRDIMPAGDPKQLRNGADLYRRFPKTFAPQLKVLFADLLNGRAPLLYNCSAGQDRTGFATAMILSALGVPRRTILEDYQLSTVYRRPEFEMPPIDAAAHPNDPVAQMFAQYHSRPELRRPQPLVEADGRPFLLGAFEDIDARWGSVEGYLTREVGLSKRDILRLRQLYLE